MDAEGIDPVPATSRRRGRIGVVLVMVLCGLLFATTARLSAGGSIRDESSDVAGVLADRGRTIELLAEENAQKRAEIEQLRGQGDGAATASARSPDRRCGSPSPTPPAARRDRSRTPTPTTWWSISRTSSPTSTRCGRAGPRR